MKLPWPPSSPISPSFVSSLALQSLPPVQTEEVSFREKQE